MRALLALTVLFALLLILIFVVFPLAFVLKVAAERRKAKHRV